VREVSNPNATMKLLSNLRSNPPDSQMTKRFQSKESLKSSFPFQRRSKPLCQASSGPSAKTDKNTESLDYTSLLLPTQNLFPMMEVGNYVLASSHEEMNPNRRHTMEDVHRIVPALCGDETLSFFAVYDGHGGENIILEESTQAYPNNYD
jgi:hypothetical protein